VFFKGKDVDDITAAFRKFSAQQLNKTAEKPSLGDTMRDAESKVKDQALDPTPHQNRERAL